MQYSAGTLPRELRPYLDLINQVFEIEKKSNALTEQHSIQRNVRNMRNWLEREIIWPSAGQPITLSFTFHNPINEPYSETRTDCDASIAGSGTEDLIITEVIKPIVWLAIGSERKSIVQQAVVVVESKSSSLTETVAIADEQPTVNDLAAGETRILSIEPTQSALPTEVETTAVDKKAADSDADTAVNP
jgi:hypothetical protein